MAEQKMLRNQSDLPKLEAVDRIMNLPVVESGLQYAGQIYGQIKDSNNILHWAFGQAETSINSILNKTVPAVVLLHSPITVLDKILCQSLNIVEQKLPSIHLPPEMIYQNTKQYVNDMSNRIVYPILKRADSVKQIGNSVLESKYTALAADTLDDALTVADKYVDKYLPADGDDSKTENEDSIQCQTSARKAIHHIDQLSRKLQRRLTRRTLAEAKALKQHSAEAIHVVVYVVELIATDPKLALEKAKELWANLSKDEPENQARPENLEELIVMLTRESARRLVHFVNFTSNILNQLPDQMRNVTTKFLHNVEDILKIAHAEGIHQFIFEGARFQAHKFTLVLHQLNLHTTELLEQVSKNLEQEEQNIKKMPTTNSSRDNFHKPRRTPKTIANGIENSN